MQYSNLPGALGDRFFAVMDRNGNDSVSFKEFVTTFLSTYSSNLQTLLALAFEMYAPLPPYHTSYDFDNDQMITPEDVRTLLDYVPIVADQPRLDLLSSVEGNLTFRYY